MVRGRTGEQRVPHRAFSPIQNDKPFFATNALGDILVPIWAFAQAGCDMCRCNLILLTLKSCHSDAR
jgi:hypothetical protein